MSFIIREANKEDASAVLDLITELAVFEKEPTAVEITVGDIEKDGFSDNPKFKIFVAEEASIIIGIALIYMRYSTWKGPIGRFNCHREKKKIRRWKSLVH